MDDQNAGESGSEERERGSRPPTDDDLATICKRLNERDADYVVVGGNAMIHAGYLRFTGDIDLLVDPSLENEAKVFDALTHLEDKAVLMLDPGDLAKHIVLRVSDEVLVDLMAAASGFTYEEAEKDILIRDVKGVRVPFASPALLWKMKSRTHRAKDESDLVFLRQLFDEEQQESKPAPPRGRIWNFIVRLILPKSYSSRSVRKR